MKPLNETTVKEYWAFMQNKYGTRARNKQNAIESKIMAKIVKEISNIEYNTFIKNYSTILGKTIYIPFEIGSKDVSYIQQIMVCNHEHEHLIHGNEIGLLIWNWKYVFSSNFRAAAETRAYITNIETRFILTGKTLNYPAAYASILLDYKCDRVDVENAHETFIKAIPMIEKGFLNSQVARDTYKWFRA